MDDLTIDGRPAELLDRTGRLVVTPHPVLVDGQRNIPADLRPGETLEAFLERHVPNLHSGAWSVAIGGLVVPPALWSRTRPRDGQVIECRAVVQQSALRLVAMAALAYFTIQTGGLASGLIQAGVRFGSAAAIGAFNWGVFIAGSLLINKVLTPKVPKADSTDTPSVYSLSGASNSARQYEPLPLLFGEVRVKPDLASLQYTWFEGDEQYLACILLGGINVDHYDGDILIGDTPITSYQDATVYTQGFPGMVSQDVPLYSNPDSIAGGELAADQSWVQRTSSAGTIALQVDIEWQLVDMGNDGKYKSRTEQIDIQYRAVGAVDWQTFAAAPNGLTNKGTKTRRTSFTRSVPTGQYEVRCRQRNAVTGTRVQKSFNWTQLKSFQPDTTDYSQWGRIGLRIKATGQLNGALSDVSVNYVARPVDLWDGTKWVKAATRDAGLSNPGAIMLQYARGIYRDGVLQAGMGLADEQIDLDAFKAFMLHCTEHGYNFDAWITDTRSHDELLTAVALAGMGQYTWAGGRLSVAWAASGQPIDAVANMATMKSATFSLSYALANTADGIEYQYSDRDQGWETMTIRVNMPGVTTALNPARVTGEGVTTEAHAAEMARYHLAQSLYQYKDIQFETDLEHLTYRRLSNLSISHDLTQWGYGGRLAGASITNGVVTVTLDEPVPALDTRYLGLRIPGETGYRVFQVEAFEGTSNALVLSGEWPAGVALPGDTGSNPAHDTLWCYDIKSTPGYRCRVVSVTPDADLGGAKVAVVPESDEFWTYVYTGKYTPSPNQSLIPQLSRPAASNLRVTEQINVAGGVEQPVLNVAFDITGDYDHSQVWAGLDGDDIQLVAQVQGQQASFAIDQAGNYLIEVRPFNAKGQVGAIGSVLYVTQQVGMPPWNVDQFAVQEIEGGLRRYVWAYTGDAPANFSGVEIRYTAGNVESPDWGAMDTLAGTDGFYTAHFDSASPDAGTWTFAIRARNNDGMLSEGMLLAHVVLGSSFAQIQAPDLTPPPAPTGLSATGGLTSVQVTFNVPGYTAGHGHARTVIYASADATATFDDATQVAETYAGPVSFNALPATTYRIWAKNQSVDGVLSTAAGPVDATTGQDVGKLLDVLQGQITESQLYASLSAEIDLISNNAAGSVNARLLAEAQERAQAIAAEAQERAQAIAAEAQKRAQAIDVVQAQVADIVGAAEYDPGTAYAEGTLVKHDNKLYRAKSNVPAGTLPTNTTYWQLVGDYASIGEAVAALTLQMSQVQTELDAQGPAVAATASTTTMLAAQMRDDDGDGALARALNDESSRAAIRELRTVRVTDLEAQAAINVSLAAQIGTNTAAIQTEQTARTTKDSALASDIETLQAASADNTALIQQEATTRASEDSALAGQITTVASQIEQQAAALSEESSTRATQDSALAQQITALQATTSATSAALQEETAARSSADSALGNRTTAIEARMPTGSGQLATAGAVSDLSGRVTVAEGQITSQSGQLTSLSNEITTARNGASSLDNRLDGIDTAVAGKASAAAMSALQSTVTQQGDTITSQGSSITTLTNSLKGAAAAGSDIVPNPGFDPAGFDIGMGGGTTILASTASEVPAGCPYPYVASIAKRDHFPTGMEYTQTTPGDVWEFTALVACGTGIATFNHYAHRISRVGASQTWTPVGTPMAASSARTWVRVTYRLTIPDDGRELMLPFLQIEQSYSSPDTVWYVADWHVRNITAAAQAQATADAAASATSALTTRVTNAEGQISSQGSAITALQATTSATSAALQEESTTRASKDDALAQQITTAQAAADSGLAQVQQEASVRADQTGYLGAQYAVRIALTADGKTVIGGFGIMGTSSGDAGPTITYGVLANQFWIGAPSGSTGVSSVQPFVVQTTAQTVNGVSVPAGVYMDAAYINNVTALWGRFGTLVADTIQATAISASQLTLGDGTVGGDLKSSNYVAGSAGWRIRQNGTAEFSGVVVRGTVYATAGQIGGATISSSYVQSANYSASNKTGWRLNNSDGSITAYSGTFGGNLSAAGGTFSGDLSAAGGTFNGSLSAATGTFAGDLSAAGGTFSGTLTATAVNAVNTINIAGNAVSTTNAATATNTLSFDNGSERSALSLTVNTYGGKLLINAGLLADSYRGVQGYIIIRLKRNGTTIKEFWVQSAYLYTVGDNNVYYGWPSYLNIPPIVENVGAETITYELTAALQNTGIGTRWSIFDRSIVITEFKR